MSVELKTREQMGLRVIQVITAQELRKGLSRLGTTLQTGVRSRMRKDTGAEQSNVRKRVVGAQMSPALEVYGTLPQTLVDEYGRRPGAKMPPYKKGSALYKWVGRKGLGEVYSIHSRKTLRTKSRKTGNLRGLRDSKSNRQEQTAFLIARAISRRGIKPTQPFLKTLYGQRADIDAQVTETMAEIIRRVESAGSL